MLGRVRFAYQRVTLLVLLAVILPALGLVALGVDTVRRQRRAVEALRRANLRLAGERLTTEIEDLIAAKVDRFLGDARATSLAAEAMRVRSPEELRRVREAAHELDDAPFVRGVFVLENGVPLFPRAHDIESLRLDEVVGTEPARRFREAERLETSERLPGALDIYSDLERKLRDPRARALALSRIARCQRKLGNVAAAMTRYRELRDDFGDVHDLFRRPYALVASIELADERSRATVTRDLADGRWELSADQVEFFLTELSSAQRPRTTFLDETALARVLEDGFRGRSSLAADAGTRPLALPGPHQVFYRRLDSIDGRELFIGLDIDLDWVTTAALPEAHSRARLDDGVVPRIVRHEKEGGIAFANLFPFWAIQMDVIVAPGQGDAIAFVGAILLVLGFLGFGLLLVVRDAARERRLAAMRSDLVSGVSHELKTPLTLIRLYAETLLHGGKHSPGDRDSYYRIILRESERLTHLIDKVLDFALIHRDQKQYHLVVGDLASVVSDTVEAYREYLTRRGFAISVEISSELPPVRFDGHAVSQAVVNLVDNAVKYAGKSKFVGVSLFREDGSVVFLVEDRGVGIAPQEREHIFEQFYRSDDGREKGGYGLGLFLVRHIMDGHGGRVEVESEPGEGSRFRLVFPALEETRSTV